MIPRGRELWLITVWLVAVAVLGAGLGIIRAGYSPLDDPDQARQRPGFIDANGPRSVAPRLPGMGGTGSRSVVFFTRPERLPRLLSALGEAEGASLRRQARVLIVEQGAAAAAAPAGVTVLSDPVGKIRRALAMRVPRDGGYPVGYAVVGPDGTIRYRTEDPGQDRRISEVLMALGAT